MDNFIGEIRLFTGNFAPKGWAFCNGQLLPISQNTALFSLLGTFYGGNGTSNFALPNLQASFPLGQGAGPGLTPRSPGETGGEAAVSLLTSQIPSHAHALESAPFASSGSPGAGLALSLNSSGAPVFKPASNLKSMAAATISPTGSGSPHENRQPYLAVNFIIALQGIFPARP